jgi:hypothetical protein
MARMRVDTPRDLILFGASKLSEVSIHLTKDKRLPVYITCPECGGFSRRVPHKPGVYHCWCGAETTLDAAELGKLIYAGKVRL